MKTRYLVILATLAFLGFSVPAAADRCAGDGDTHRHCKPVDPPAPSATYTAELTGSVFHFDTVDVTTDQKQAELFPPDKALKFSRPDEGTAAATTWDAVFAACENFFGSNPVIGPTSIPPPSEFTAPAGNWEIGQSGGVGVAWWGIEFDENGIPTQVSKKSVHFTVVLILQGDTFFDNPKASFLPGPENPVLSYDILEASISGGTVKGVRPKVGCVSGGRAPRTLLGDAKSTLVITATE